MRVLSGTKKPLAAHPALRVCEVLTLVGLLITMNSMAHTTGLSFTLFTLLGTPLMLVSIVVLGVLLFEDFRKRYSLFSVVAYEPGENVISQGDAADRAYFIQKGEVEVIRDERGKQTRVATMKEGDYFGEMALLQPEARRTATVRAVGDVEVMVLGKENFYRLLQALPTLHEQFLAQAHERVRQHGNDKPAEGS